MSTEECIVVETPKGSLRGRKATSERRGTYWSFQGIPYGKPPVGNMRFKAAQEADSWTGIRDALKEGPVAPGLKLFTQDYDENSSEDCLYLNVYTAKIPESKAEPLKAVMFWVHGGAFISGSGNTNFFSPDYLVTEDIVLVTCNYRLGPIGFLSLQNQECPGNCGLKDLLLALKWCQQNISSFGGDPNNVTIFGQSAGGALVHYLMLTPKSEGLFHKVIAQSGVSVNIAGIGMKPKEYAFKLGEFLGCKTTDEKELLEFLRRASPKDLITKSVQVLKAVEPEEHYLQHAFVPCVEPNVEDALITKHPDDIYKLGQIRKVPILLGANTLEGLLPLRGTPTLNLETDEQLKFLIPKNLKVDPNSKDGVEILKMIRNFYFPQGFDQKSYLNALSSIYYVNGVNQVIDHHSKLSTTLPPAYVYQFAFNGDVYATKQFFGFGNWKGTCHNDDLTYLFIQRMFNYVIPKGTREFKMMETFTKLWTNFAKTGTPVPLNPSSWSPISTNTLPYMEMDDALTQKTDMGRKEFAFWLEVLKVARRTNSDAKL